MKLLPYSCLIVKQKGQLGHGDLFQRNMPTLVEGLRGKPVLGGASGRHHSVIFTSSGKLFLAQCCTSASVHFQDRKPTYADSLKEVNRAT